MFGKETINELLVPLVFDIQSDSIIDDKDIAERFLGESQLFATVNQIPYQPKKELIDNLRVDMAEKIDSIYFEYLEDQKMRLETSKALQIQRTEEFYNNKIKVLEQTVKDLEYRAQYAFSEEERTRIQRILPAQRGLLKNMTIEKDESIQKIDESVIHAKAPKLLSLSQIKVY